MKTAVACTAALLVAAAALAALSPAQVKRLNESAIILSELRDMPEGISDELWGKARCAIVIPSLKKAAFVVGGEYGVGVMSCRRDGGWSAPIFMQLAKGSLGFQI